MMAQLSTAVLLAVMQGNGAQLSRRQVTSRACLTLIPELECILQLAFDSEALSCRCAQYLVGSGTAAAKENKYISGSQHKKERDN